MGPEAVEATKTRAHKEDFVKRICDLKWVIHNVSFNHRLALLIYN